LVSNRELIGSFDNLPTPNRRVERQADVELLAVAFGRQSIDEHPSGIVGKHVNGLHLEYAAARRPSASPAR
jgi:hypothetical protein